MTTGRRSLFRPLLLIALVFGVIWAITIMRWRGANRVPDGAGIVLYLIAFPVVVLLLIWAGTAVFRTVKKSRQNATAANPVTATREETPADPTLGWRLPILAFDTLLPAGDSTDAVVEAAASGKRVDLHPRLRNAKAQPVFAAEVSNLDVDAVREGLPEAARDWADGRLRTLALALAVASRALEHHFDALRPPAASTQPSARKQPVAELEWWLPTLWDESTRKTAGQWLTAQLADSGWNAPELTVQTRAMTGTDAALHRLDALNLAYHQPPADRAVPRLVLAAESFIDETVLANWSAQDTLFDTDHTEGRVPGEGASIVILAAPGQAEPPTVAYLHRVFRGTRTRPVDQPQRIQADTLDALATQARAHAPTAAIEDSELKLVSDTDIRASRTPEALQLTEAVLPDAAPETVLHALGVANGDCGIALTLALVAAAAGLCTEPRHAALIFSQSDPSQRLVAMVTAPPAPPSPQASDAPSLQTGGT